MRGRITQVDLPLAEESIPGITAFAAKRRKKSQTFLELLWSFEGARRAAKAKSAVPAVAPRAGRRANPVATSR